MKILHFADLHTGVENYGRVNPVTGLSTRVEDFLSAFDQVVDFALEEKVDLVLFCGDAYKGRDPSQTHQREFARRIARLSAAGIPVFLLAGNHDLPSVMVRATTLEIFSTLAVPNVYIGNRLGVTIVPTRDGPLQVLALPWITRSHILSLDDYKNVPAEGLIKLMEEKITQAVQELAKELDPDLPAVLAGHVTVSSARLGSEQSMMLGRDPVILRSNLLHPALDYVALGHVHRHQVFDGPAPVVYSGSLQRVDFSEEEEDKGFCLVEIDPSRPPGERTRSCQFIKVAARPFVTVSLRAATEDPTQEVLRAIGRKEVRDAVVRVQVKLPSRSAIGGLDVNAIYRALSAAYFIAAVSLEVEDEARPRLHGVAAEKLTPLKALELYLERKKVPKERAKVLLEYGRRLMHEASQGWEEETQ